MHDISCTLSSCRGREEPTLRKGSSQRNRALENNLVGCGYPQLVLHVLLPLVDNIQPKTYEIVSSGRTVPAPKEGGTREGLNMLENSTQRLV
jgi:hypothetical protein